MTELNAETLRALHEAATEGRGILSNTGMVIVS